MLLAELFALSRLNFRGSCGAIDAIMRTSSIRYRAPLFHEFLLPFEVTSVVLLVAVVGAVVLAKRGSEAS